MKKLITLSILFCFLGYLGYAQVPSNSMCIKLHNVNTTNMNSIASPEAGMLVYNTDSAKAAYYSGTQWFMMQNSSERPYIQITNTLSPDINVTPDTLFTWWDTDVTKRLTNAATSYTVSTDGITVTQEGVYRVTVYQAQIGKKNDQCTGFRFTVNGVNQAGLAANAWLRDKGTLNATASLVRLISLSANDKVSIRNKRIGENDIVFCPAGESIFILEQVK